MEHITKKEAEKLSERDRIHYTLHVLGLRETANLFWVVWHLQHKPESKYNGWI